MIKQILVVPVCIACFVRPGLADPPASPTLQVGFKLQAGKETRTYAMKLVDRTCGSVTSKGSGQEDDIRACATFDGQQIRLDLDWTLRQGDHELRSKSSAMLVRGAFAELLTDTAKLTVSLQ